MATSTIQLPGLSNMFTVTTETATYSASANAAATGSNTFTKAGWYPLGIVGYKSGAYKCTAYKMYPSAISDGSITVSWAFRNMDSSAHNNTTATFQILWVR